MKLGRGLLRGLLLGLLAVLVLPAAALAIDEFPLANPCPPATGGGTCQPAGITAGPDGALWFTEEAGNRIGRITTGGSIAEFTAGLSSGALPTKIAAGPDGRLWFTESGINKIGAITIGGAISEYGTTVAPPDGITAGPDGRLWFTEFNTTTGTSKIGRIDIDGSNLTEFSLPSGIGPGDITAGPSPDNRLWFTESNDVTGASKIGVISSTGAVSPPLNLANASDPSGITATTGGALFFTEFGANLIGQVFPGGTQINQFPAGSGQPSGIATGSDGALWYTETGANKIGRLTTGGTVTNEFVVPTAGSQPGDIAGGADGALWFTEFVGNKIGRIAVAPPFVSPPPPPPPPASPTSTKTKCKVPKVRGLTIRKAKRKLGRAHCRFKIRGKGKVVSTNPKAGRTTTKVVQVKARAKRHTSKRR